MKLENEFLLLYIYTYSKIIFQHAGSSGDNSA